MKRAAKTRKNLFGFGSKKEPHWSTQKGGFKRAMAAKKAEAALERRQKKAQALARHREEMDRIKAATREAAIERARAKYARMMEAKTATKAKAAVKSAEQKGYVYVPSADAIQDAYKQGAKTLKEALEMAGAQKNPSKFDRCVKDVKRKGKGVNAYAVCTAAGTRKNAGTVWMVEHKPSGKLRKFESKAAAEQWARENNPRGSRENYKVIPFTVNASRKRNPADEAIAGYEDFHGRPSKEWIEVKRKIHHHEHLSDAGELKRLVVLAVDGRSIVTLKKFKGAILAFNERRNQLFVEGGDQAVDLGDFGIMSPHELETLGRVKKIDYFTRKDHLGSEGGTATYQHTFRTTNEDGRHVTIRIARYPDLIYRVLEQHLEFSGGSYEILPEGIDR